MSADHNTHEQDQIEEDDGAYLEEGDVLAELPDDGDHPMDEDEDAEGELVDGLEGEEIVWEDTSIQHFPTHRKSVFVVSTHPTQPIACSGGEDDLGYLWNIDDGEELVKLTGHTDSVTSTAFSADGQLVSTGGMDGKIRVWRKVSKSNSWKDWEFLTELLGPDEVMWLKWHPKGNVLLAGSNDSTVWLWQLPSGNTMHVLAGHTGAVNTGTFTPDGKKIVTGCQDGTLILWDPKTGQPEFKLTSEDARFGMGQGITSVAVNPASSLAIVGGADGTVRAVNLTNGTILGGLEGHGGGESIESVTFVETSFGGTAGTVAVTAGTDGKACVWDTNTMRLRATLEHADAITNLLAHAAPNGHFLTTSSSDRTLRTWDLRNGTLMREHKGHQGVINSAALVASTGGGKVVSASDDGVCLVFATQ